MAINTIGYANKVSLNTNPDIADVNKVTDADMNEIKDVVNTNANLQGNLSDLETPDKSNIVGAINSSLTKTGKHITLTKSSDQSFSAQARPTVTWDNVSYNDTNDLLIKDGNNIKINGDVHTVMVTARVQGIAKGIGQLYIMKGTDEVSIVTNGAGASGIEITDVINVVQGDLLHIEYYNPQAGRITQYSAWTHFTVTILN